MVYSCLLDFNAKPSRKIKENAPQAIPGQAREVELAHLRYFHLVQHELDSQLVQHELVQEPMELRVPLVYLKMPQGECKTVRERRKGMLEGRGPLRTEHGVLNLGSKSAAGRHGAIFVHLT